MKTKRINLFAVLIAGVLTGFTSCSNDENDNEQPASTTSTYHAEIMLEVAGDTTTVKSEMEMLENTFCQYFNAQTLKTFSMDKGSAEANDAEVERLAKLAAAAVDNNEYKSIYSVAVVNDSSYDTVYVYRPTADNAYCLSDFIGNVVTEVVVVAAESQSVAKYALSMRGYKIVNKDLNEGIGGDYVYLGLKYANVDCSVGRTEFGTGVIRKLAIIAGPAIWGKVKLADNREYELVPFYGNNQGSLNSNTKGVEMHLYATYCYKNTSRTYVCDLEVDDYKHGGKNRYMDYVWGYKSDLTYWDGDYSYGMDVNSGAGGKYRYIQALYAVTNLDWMYLD